MILPGESLVGKHAKKTGNSGSPHQEVSESNMNCTRSWVISHLCKLFWKNMQLHVAQIVIGFNN